MKNSPIIIVAGEPNSVFLEIFFKAIKKKIKSPIILICCSKVFNHYYKLFKLKTNVNILDINIIKNYDLSNRSINLIDIQCKKNNNKFNTKLTNEYLTKSFDVAIKLLKSNFSYKFINGPIIKNSFLKKKFLGITEYVSEKFNIKKNGMLIFNKSLSVCPVTTHLPIKLVQKQITIKIIKEKIYLVNNFYLKYFKLKPRIAVTGLNPHCESILKYNEDEKIIKPAIETMKKKYINVKGPFPADTIFNKKNRSLFDVVIGMYHDQVLTPIKTLYEFDAINITMGLPFLRVTPDHGPNKEMIGKNISNPSSLIRALEFLDKQ